LKPPFQTDHTPQVGVPLTLSEGLRVITCGNASPMTFTGTQTYLLGETEIAVIDPGPADPAHLAAIEKAVEGQTVSHIIVTHSHVDHSPLAMVLSAKTGAPVYGFGPADAARSKLMNQLAVEGNLGGAEGIDPDFTPDILVANGEEIKGAEWALNAVHTPGHLSNHLCFAWEGNDSLFSGDHVMGWASTLVSPPDGDLTAFMASLKTLQNRPEHTYYAGHGAPLFEAHNMLDYLLAHRLGREDQIMARLQSAPRTVAELTTDMYADVNPLLHGAASRNVLAHLIDLFERGLVTPEGSFSADARFKRT
jgi:glyoxylase-like metal-dependent hydrolase (beta-lactamase superfamily II)